MAHDSPNSVSAHPAPPLRPAVLRVDFHSHTRASPDAWTRPAELVARARAAGLDRIAVTDHHTIDGALEAHALDPTLVIVGEEIRTREGTELIGLFLSERVPPGLPFAETVLRIRTQGGVIYAPHPSAYPYSTERHEQRALAAADLAEGWNGRAFWPPWNCRAEQAALHAGVAVAAGSDAHFPWEIGRAWTVIAPFQTATELLAVRHTAQIGERGVGTALPCIASVVLEAAHKALRYHPSTKVPASAAGVP
jgi:predicted metal-dependent phosphoesterase TrpH